MKVHSNEFKNIIKKNGRQLDSKITYTLNGVNVELGKEQLNSITPTYQGALLKSVMKELDIDSNVYIPEKTILNYQFGVKVNGKYEYINFGNYVVYKVEKQEDTNSYKLTCYDKMLYSMTSYEKMNITYPISIRDYINAICNKLGLTFKNANSVFANYNKIIKNELYLDADGKSLDYTFRDVLDELSQATASCICINENDELEIRYINYTNDTIDEEFLKDININFGGKYGPINSIVLSRSAESDNVYLQDEESVQANGLCELKIVDNQIMNWNDRSDYLPEILNKLDGLEYYINDFASTGIAYLELCDRYNIKIGDNTYSCVMLNDELDVTQGLVENIHTDMPMETKTDYTKADKTDRRINQTSLIVDKQTQEITALVSKTDNLETKTAQLRLDVDTIEGQISDIADITTTSEGVGTLVMQNINESEPIYLKIYPKLGDIKYLYPAEDLYPSETLFPKVKTLRFHCTSENYDAEYELSKDLLWLNNDVYDEFILDYDNSACYVIRRVGINADGTKYALTNSTQEDLTYPTIRLINGDYEVSLVGQPTAYLYVRLMVQNIYTTQFATKVELNSTIKQTKDEIDLEVSKKVGNDEVISKINQTAETITIQANKVNISGVISAINNNTTTTINGDKITTGSITASKVSSDIITTGNFNAQKINADNITSGTLSADKINGGTISASNINLKGVSLTPSTSSIGGLNVSSGTISNSRMGLDTANGIVRVFNNNGGSMILSNAVRLSATAGVGISSNSNGNISAPSKNLDLKACSGAVAYLGCMSDASGTNEKSAISCENGTLKLRSTGAIYANGVAIGGSSSKATKENIKDLSQEKKDELYNLIRDIPLKEYDYKEQYGKKENYGFIIEDIENTKLNTLLHIVQNKNNKDMKNYSSEDLARLELVIIQELMKKNEMLEKRIEKLERNDK